MRGSMAWVAGGVTLLRRRSPASSGHSVPPAWAGRIRVGWVMGFCVVLVLAVGAFLAYEKIRECFETLDSDVLPVRRKIIDDRLQRWMHTRLPPSADDIHVVISGGLSPCMILRFTADREETGRFFQQALKSWDRSARWVAPPPWLEDMANRSWWKPSSGAPWWGFRDSDGTLIIQSDGATGTVYFVVLAK